VIGIIILRVEDLVRSMAKYLESRGHHYFAPHAVTLRFRSCIITTTNNKIDRWQQAPSSA
jgi:hypothetical protein